MKKLKYILNGGYTDWQAMLPVSFNGSSELIELLEDCSWEGGVWESNDVLKYLLVGDRTIDPNSEEVEKLGYEGFAKKYPHGKPLHQPGDKGQEFRDILEWGSIFMTEHKVTDNPENGGGSVYRIVSPKLKSILEQFNLPPHRFYPAEVIHEITGEKQPYYLFHLTYENGHYLQNSYWPMMETIIIKKGSYDQRKGMEPDQELKRFEKGSFTDFQDYINKTHTFERSHANIQIEGKIDYQTEEGRIAREKLRDYRSNEPYYVYKEDYDLMGFDTTMIISENLKRALDEHFPKKNLYFESKNIVDVVTGYQPGDELPF